MSSVNTSVSSIVSKKSKTPKVKKPPYRVLPNTKITPEPHPKDEVSSSASVSTISTIISEPDTSPPSLFEESYSISVSEFPATSIVSEVGAPGDIDEFLSQYPPKAPVDRKKYKMWIVILVSCGLFVIVLSVSSLTWFFITRPDLKEQRPATTTSIPSDFLFQKAPSIVAVDDDNQGRSLKDVETSGGGNENAGAATANGRSLQIVSDNQNQNKAPHQSLRNSYDSYGNFSNPRHQKPKRPVTERIAEIHDDVPRPKKSLQSIVDEPTSKTMAPASGKITTKQEDTILKSLLEETDDLSRHSRKDRDNPQYSEKVIMVESSEKPSLKPLPSYASQLAPDSDISSIRVRQTTSFPIMKYYYPLPPKATRKRLIKSRPEKKRRKRLNPDCPPDCIPGEWCRVKGIGQWMKC